MYIKNVVLIYEIWMLQKILFIWIDFIDGVWIDESSVSVFEYVNENYILLLKYWKIKIEFENMLIDIKIHRFCLNGKEAY